MPGNTSRAKYQRGLVRNAECHHPCLNAHVEQRVVELQEVMEEYLKRFRINLSDKSKLIQDLVRLEAQLSLTLTQLKTCLLGGDCDSR